MTATIREAVGPDASVRVCALIPAHNEAATIGSVVAGAVAHVHQVIVVDDGSTDGTGDRANAAGAVTLRLACRSGKGAALRHGLAHLVGTDITHVLFMDGDGQHRPEDIPSLLRVLNRTGADLVIGCRTCDEVPMPASRRFSNTVGSRIASTLIGQPVADTQSGFRLARLACLRQLALRSTRYEFEMEVLIKMSRMGCRIAQAPVTTVYEGGMARSKMQPVRDTIRICIWSLIFRFAGG